MRIPLPPPPLTEQLRQQTAKAMPLLTGFDEHREADLACFVKEQIVTLIVPVVALSKQ